MHHAAGHDHLSIALQHYIFIYAHTAVQDNLHMHIHTAAEREREHMGDGDGQIGGLGLRIPESPYSLTSLRMNNNMHRD